MPVSVSCEVRTSRTYEEVKVSRETGRPGSEDCELFRIPLCLDCRLTDGGEFSALRAGRPLSPEIFSDTNFCQGLSPPQGHSTAGSIR
jgi:hypothetical protein